MRTVTLIALFVCVATSVTSGRVGFDGQNDGVDKITGHVVVSPPSVEGNDIGFLKLISNYFNWCVRAHLKIQGPSLQDDFQPNLGRPQRPAKYHHHQDDRILKQEKADLQQDYYALFYEPQRNVTIPPSSSYLVDDLQSRLEDISRLCGKHEIFLDMHPTHKKAYRMLTLLLREHEANDLMKFSKTIKNSPNMNYKLWLRAFRTVVVERPELVVIRPPNMIAVTPDMFGLRNTDVPSSRKDGIQECTVMNGSFTENAGIEHQLWYFREDFLLNGQHEYWHIWFTKIKEALHKQDRRGELFYYFHHNLINRYQADRLAFGLKRIGPLNLTEGVIIEEGYHPHMEDINAKQEWGHRKPNTPLRNIEKWDKLKQLISSDIAKQTLYHSNGTTVDLRENIEGIDFLGDLVEASDLSINKDRYKSTGDAKQEYGLHNSIHDALSMISLSENGEPGAGIMGHTAVAVRDPIFYKWHKFIDSLFTEHKSTLKPYQPEGGVLPLKWPQVSIEKLEVKSHTAGRNVNELQTGFTEVIVSVPIQSDVSVRSIAEKEMHDYCITSLNHTDFEYHLEIKNERPHPVSATLRIFMAPRWDEIGNPFTMEEQRQMFFSMGEYKVELKSGTHKIKPLLSKDAINSLTRPWDYYSQVIQPATYLPEVPKCGCGWPHHMLLPRGKSTPEGMDFDLFAMLTDGLIDNPKSPSPMGDWNEPEVCTTAHVMCGNYNGTYPDTRPMGYPFDRKVYSDPKGTLDDFVGPISNMKTIQVKIFHKEG